MLHKAIIVLFLYTLKQGLDVEGEVISTKSPTSYESTPTDTIFCPEEEVISGGGFNYGTFVFPETEATLAGVTVKVECKFGFRNDGLQSIYGGQLQQTRESKMEKSGAIRTCILDRSEDGGIIVGKWQPLASETNISYCKEEGQDNVLSLWEKTVKTITPATFTNIFSFMHEVLNYAYSDHECALAFINGIDSLMRNPELGADVITKDARDQVLAYVDLFATNIAKSLPPGYKLQVGDGGIIIETARFYGIKHVGNVFDKYFGLQPYVTNFATLDATDVEIAISAEALRMSLDDEDVANKNPSLKITVYSEDVLRNWNTKSATAVSVKSDLPGVSSFNETCSEDCGTDGDKSDPYKSWGLLTIELDGKIQNLTEPVEFIISNSTLGNGHKMTCVFWDNTTEKWSTEGLMTIMMDDGVKCKSTHLTAFSALIEPLPLPFPGAEYAPVNTSVHKFILSILSSIGSVCSIVGLGFTLLTYGLFRCLRKERSNRILINLSSSLLLMHIMSISGSKNLWDGYCFFPAVSLHYLVLTSLAWMMVEAVHMYELLISVFVRPENRFLTKRIILAWGIPMIIVSTCAIVRPEVYRVGRADLCLMSAHENIVLYYAAYIGPICVMLLVNIIIFGKIFRVLYQQTKRTNMTATRHDAPPRYQFVKISPSQIKGATTVLVLLGIGWTLGLLAMGPFEVLFRYLYCICNAGQGLFIFIFRVLLNPHASKQWKKVILGLSSDSSLDVSVATSTTMGFGKGKKRKSDIMISPNFISASNSVENSLTPSNPLSATLAKTLASILRSEDARAATCTIDDEK